MSTDGWKISKTDHACNTFPAVWGAIHGCTGRGRNWRYTVNGFGHRVAEFACDVCKAERKASDALVGQAYQDRLRAQQDVAGVADYRNARARKINGVPVLVKK